MKMTKLGHAALKFENENGSLIIDPGAFTESLDAPTGDVAVVVTHLHADHWTADQLSALRDAASTFAIFGPAGVVNAAAEQGIEVTTVVPGQSLTAAGFTLDFFGGSHAVILPSIPRIDNVGVLVNQTVFHPGDSLQVPDVHVPVLAVPLAAPWLKLSEAVDFVGQVRPERAFPIHDAVLSDNGYRVFSSMLEAGIDADVTQYAPLRAGDAEDIPVQH